MRRHLGPVEAVEGMDVVQEHQAQDCADPRHRWPSGQRLGIGLCCRVDDGDFHVVQEVVVVPDARQVPCDTFGPPEQKTARHAIRLALYARFFPRPGRGTGGSYAARARGVRPVGA